MFTQYALYLCINILSRMQLTCGLIVVDTDPVQLQVTVSMVSACGVNAVLIADHFPELQKTKWKVSHESYLQRKCKPLL